MEKCGNDSARAGESNASINGPIGLLLTQSLAILFIRAHCIGFFRKLLSHTYPGWDFRSTSSRRWKINKNEEKCTFAFGVWVMARLVSIFHFGCLFRFPHPHASSHPP